jgi:SAM-dependent methyltransferase
MTETEDLVTEHYGTHHVLEDILGGLDRAGFDRNALHPADLKPIDEFHTGGLEATKDVLSQLSIGEETRVLDVGSGIGGTSRYIAEHFGAHVTGVDLTPEYIEAARFLTRAVGLDEKVVFEVGSATDLPVAAGGFDLALMFHVGMNIADKAAMFCFVSQALRRGGTFAIFDVMAGRDFLTLAFPLPWADTGETSFVGSPQDYREAAEAAGFRLAAERDRGGFALEFFRGVIERIERDGAPPIGLHLLMGETSKQKISNYIVNLEAGRIAPREMIFEKL